MDANETLARDYHEATKHHRHRFARSPGGLDWATQPEPFRRYAGAPVLALPRGGLWAGPPSPVLQPRPAPTWDAVRAGLVPGPPAPADDHALGDLFLHSLAISAWKQVTSPGGQVVSRWALRANPSSGNLHPTEAWLIDGRGVHHYAADRHALERRAAWAENVPFRPADLGLPPTAFLLALSAIPWREAWKYGERAFRYCQHDAGHALAAVGLAAARLGWIARRLEGVGTAELAALLGLDTVDAHEYEHAEALLAVVPGPWPGGVLRGRPPLPAPWRGRANRLSGDHRPWPLVREMATAVAAPADEAWSAPPDSTPPAATPPPPARPLDAGLLIRRRRSAVAMDGRSTLSAPAFFRLLASLLPRPGFDPALAAVGPDVDVSVLLLVHRVTDLTPGLYLLCRAPGHEADLRAALRPDFAWERVPGCPPGLPLFRLGTGDLREAARQISCGQDIAADGVFSCGLLARFEAALAARGAPAWSRLFQETGALGQLLYLEAEAAGLRGTGIGCFLDDDVHRAIGLVDHRWQSLYHFTVGGGVDDPRLGTAPAYEDDDGREPEGPADDAG